MDVDEEEPVAAAAATPSLASTLASPRSAAAAYSTHQSTSGSSTAVGSDDGSQRRIVRLTDETINRIAAGEVVQRPASALKELLENAIDAGSTSIRIQAKDGGLKVLSIQDNGSGIKKADLPLLCERFATSKLRSYDDLSSIETYGFRGEALASISHVAHVTVVTKTRQDPCGYKARYLNGALVPLIDTSSDAEPKPTAANDGTHIQVEDLFYNTPIRRKGMRSANDEYAKILDVVSKYAIHNAGIAMSCKKIGSNSADLTTTSNASTLDVLGLVYSEAVKRELNELRFDNQQYGLSCKGYVSGANYSSKRGTFIFFINHRLVDCSPLKRNLEAFYTSVLPKGGSPFIYLSLQIHPSRVDVNVSPTKSEVHFLDQDDVIELVCSEMQKRLASANQSRNFSVQTLLPSAAPPRPAPAAATPSESRGAELRTATAEDQQPRKPSSSRLPPQKLVRTDASAQTLEAMFGHRPVALGSSRNALTQNNKRKLQEVIELADSEGSDQDSATPQDRDIVQVADGETEPELDSQKSDTQTYSRAKIPESECDLTSIQELRRCLEREKHVDLGAIVKKHSFVGTVDLDTGRSLLQHGTKLYLVDHNQLSEELFYQLALRQFSKLGRLQLKPAPRLRDLLQIAVENEESVSEAGVSPSEIVDIIHDKLMDRAEMLEEYFSVGLDTSNGTVSSIPMILPGWTPNLNKLPLFFLRLGAEVDWTDEKLCFRGFLRELAFCNSPEPMWPRDSGDDMEGEEEAASERQRQEKQHLWQLKHVVFPAMRYLQPPRSMIETKAIVHVASLENLYKVFERC